ncbi:hypothetical protein GLP14_09265 [Photobacterium carnosum]|uniref:NAD(P)-dependent oxidoreductase n=1 Tax=Photobacterium carnosum TaxID=2023717 RepID=UPI001E3B4CB9|nr:NAD(P)-dependent oxidoreductase [Photobacterium carnosum]MCD9523008.1 hypothetical protein [Photobacterium carnosum]
MMPLILIQPLRVAVIGAGKAGVIKARSALRYQQDVTLIATEFSEAATALNCHLIYQDFYQMSPSQLNDWQLIYLAIPWPSQVQQQDFIRAWALTMMTQHKLLCVSCQPSLGNVVNPCSRQVEDYTLTVSGADMRPKTTKNLTNQLAQQFALMLKDNAKK